MEKQTTIEKEVSISGRGIHTGNKVNVTLKPAVVDSGVNFMRTDLAQRPVIKGHIEYLLGSVQPHRRTCIGKDDVEVFTIEHFMSALAGLGIDNILVELDASEMPGLDGSSLNYQELLKQAGLKEQDKPRQTYQIRDPIVVEEDDSYIVALPCPELRISYTLSYNHPYLKAQYLELNINPAVFEKELGPARTFCLEEEALEIQSQGLGQGANYENTLVVGNAGVIKNKLRFPDEFVRHKISDLLGDLCLVGLPVKAHIVAIRSGHSLNVKLARKIYEQRQRALLSGIAAAYQPKETAQLDVEAIMKILPHRQPFLFVDRILHLEKGKRAIGLKNVTINDYFFKGHFPARPVMPGVLVIEAMAQVGGIMMLAAEENRGKLAFFLAINNAKFRKTVVPGDQLTFELEAGKIRSKTGQVYGKAYVEGKLVAEAELIFALVGP
jgi:UDP-3-O-[3-hydroxymyristoyl] N-acetylglucosamine deacetylase/3-hydroxyacyl-[acyl-carrier-protein] dehydratase